jgi:hypothetical protein
LIEFGRCIAKIKDHSALSNLLYKEVLAEMRRDVYQTQESVKLPAPEINDYLYYLGNQACVPTAPFLLHRSGKTFDDEGLY